jgi:hypothetical protein
MECLIANLNGKVRREKWLGRDYYVAPAALIVPGVLPGSLGPLFYPEDEVRRNPDAWNNVPLVLEHPVENGRHISARQPKVLEQYGLGTVFEANANGKLTAEAWFDIERTRAVDQRNGTDILARLERGESLELSTGLFTTNIPAPPGSQHNGRPYTHVAKDYRPDHLAILHRTKGACSLDDGCGILANADGTLNASATYPTTHPSCGGTVDPKTGKCAKCGQQVEPVANEYLADEPAPVANAHGWSFLRWLGESLGIVRNTPGEGFDSDEQRRAFFGHLKDAKAGKGGKFEQPKATTAGEFLAGFHNQHVATQGGKSWSTPHGDYQGGKDWIEHNGGKLVHSTTSTSGKAIETYHVSFPDRDVLATWGQAPVKDRGGKELNPTWRMVTTKGHTRNAQPSDKADISSRKACQILHDGSVHGHELTEQQRKFFGAICSEKDLPTHNAACCPECIEAAYNRDFPQSKRDKLDHADFAGPDQSFPILTQADVDAAAHLVGKAADPEAVKRKIIAIARRKGLKVPEAWTTNATGDAPSATPDHQAAMTSLAESTSHESATARRASERALKSGRGEDHRLAADAHRVAAEHHRGMGHNRMTEAHATVAAYHSSQAHFTGNTEAPMDNLIVNAFATNEERKTAFDRLDNCGSEKSAAAVTASRIANQRRDPSAHRDAVRAHQSAGQTHLDAGNKPLAIDHFRAAKDHEGLAANSSTERPAMNDTERKTIVSSLITANCACEGDRAYLEKLSDGALVALNAKSGVKKNLDAADAEDATDMGADEEEENLDGTKKKKPTANDFVPPPRVRPRQKSAAEWLAAAPPEVQSAVRNAMKLEQQQKAAIVEQIVTNGDYADDSERDADAKELMGLSLDDLQKQLRRSGRVARQEPEYAPLYYGAAGGPTTNAKDDSDNLLPSLTVNWDDMASPRLLKQA